MADRSLWVFCSGLRRSGSTVQYQLTKTLVEGSGRGVGLGFAGEKNWFDLLRQHRGSSGIHVVKCHRYLPGAASMLRSGTAKSIFIHRDFRDVCVSWMKMTRRSFDQVMAEGFFDDLLEDDFHWSGRPNTMTSVYEEMLDDLTGEVLRIAAFLDIPVSREEAEQIADQHSLGRQQRRIASFDYDNQGIRHGNKVVYDPRTLLHHNHVHSGAIRQWEKELTATQVERIEVATGDRLVAHGYDLVTDAPAQPSVSWSGRQRLRLERLAADVRIRLRLRFAPTGTGGARFVPAPIRAAVKGVLKGIISVPTVRLIGRPLYALAGRTGPAPDLSEAERILVVRLDRIGDVVLTIPFLRELRRSAPRAEITVVVRPGLSDLLAESPHADRVLTFDPDVQSRVPELVRRLRLLRLARAHFWRQKPDIAIGPRWGADYYDAPFLLYFSGATRRVAYAHRHRPGPEHRALDRLMTETVEGPPDGHEVARNLDLLKRIGGTVAEEGLELTLSDADREYADGVWKEHRLGGVPVVALGVGASHSRRLWPAERYAELATRLADAHGARSILIGSGDERALGTRVASRAGESAIDLVGTTTLRQAAALLERCDLFIGNDSGVLHLAGAVDTPLIGIWCGSEEAPTDHSQSPVRFGPWGVPAAVIQPATTQPPCTGTCSASEAHCILDVDVDEVERAAGDLLARTSEERASVQARGA